MSDIEELMHRRRDLLEAIATGTRRKPALVDDINRSRSTIDRGIRELANHNLIERTDGGYETTTRGQLHYSARENYLESFETIERHSDLIDGLDRGEHIPLDVLRGATKLDVPEHMPEQTVRSMYKYIDAATAVRGLSPFMVDIWDRMYYEPIVDGDLTLDTINNDAVYQTITTEYHDRFGDMLAAGDVSAYRNNDIPSYCVVWIETPCETPLFVFGRDQGSITGALRTQSEYALSWAREQMRTYREDADLLYGTERSLPECS